MQIKTLIVLVGTYGSGKTTFAKYYAACHADIAYLDVDVLSGLDSKVFEYGAFLQRLKALIGNTRYNIYILDGAPDTLVLSGALQRDLDCQVAYWMCYASPDIIRERQKQKNYTKGLPQKAIRIEMVNYYIAAMTVAKYQIEDVWFIDTGCSEHYSWYTFDKWITHWQELCLLARYPKDYQDIRLANTERAGHSESFRTWGRLASIYDFKDKSVIDYGTNLGYFLFKAEDAGAGELLGVDRGGFTVAHEAAMIRGSKAVFQTADLNSFKPDKMYDVALCLNVLHHIACKRAFLINVFTTARDVLFETPTNMCVEIDNKAQLSGSHLVCHINSHRDGRVILFYSKDTEPFIPPTFAYTWRYYQTQRLRKWVMGHMRLVRLTGKVLRLLGLYRPVYRIIAGRTRI